MGLKLRYFYEVKTAEFGVAKCNEKVFTFFHKQAEEASADILFSFLRMSGGGFSRYPVLSANKLVLK